VVLANMTRNADEAMTARSDVAPSRVRWARIGGRRRGRGGGSVSSLSTAASHDGRSGAISSANSMAP
jgi:hypothetical protein